MITTEIGQGNGRDSGTRQCYPFLGKAPTSAVPRWYCGSSFAAADLHSNATLVVV